LIVTTVEVELYFTIKFGCDRGDTIETLKILTGKYDALVSPTLNTANSCITRANE